MIVVESLKKTYETKAKIGFLKSEKRCVEAVKKLDMEIEKGKIVGLLGINGAGKTTSIKMLSTLLLPTAGRITMDGIDAVKDSMQVKKKINMIAGGERMIYWRLTGRENLWYFGQLYGIENRVLSERIDYLLKLVGIEEKQDVPVENYSKGMKQRLQIARGLINNPDYIFMDEPTLGLDSVISRELRTHIQSIASEEGKGILLTSHYMAEIEELCDYVYILNKGEVIAKGTPKELAMIGMNKKTLYLNLERSKGNIHQILCEACTSADKTATVQAEDREGGFIITSSLDLKGIISKACIDHRLVIHKLFEEEPKLEDAIIKLSKGA
ncbi:ABC transporter ATP-binding protein [Geosporobacter ferrireducens]|uniref:Daunorubicin ABC transporter ATP-binding protein n=1 Tax=Geosporobacter ferrireducens TaxID=1424294 RepID=A0A1D8GKS0_9FIRM|nr:ABC transporter ATP-binding protein [Geosporobacter ferrireducens]AOT71515.1 daunorubicin ABC transporter ATP-binding protein [Geosporobacter ferrireducens]MTI57829.1 ABC transporter ATP-binding protein [Geosporobacter ferrireducens]